MISIQQYIYERSNFVREVDLDSIAKDILSYIKDSNKKVLTYDFDKNSYFDKTVGSLKIRINDFEGKFIARIRTSGDKYVLEIQKSKINDSSRFVSTLTHELTHLYELTKGLIPTRITAPQGTTEAKLQYLLSRTEMDARCNQVRSYITNERHSYSTIRQLLDSSEFENISRIEQIRKLIEKLPSYEKKYNRYKQKIYRIVYDTFK